MTGMKIQDWREMRRGKLLGFVKVELPSGMVLHDVTILAGDNGPWASPPSKPMIGKDGPLTDRNGKPRYQPVIEFISKEVRDRFSAGVIEALRASNPEAPS